METTEFKTFIAVVIIVLVVIAIELPARLVKHFFQKPDKNLLGDHVHTATVYTAVTGQPADRKSGQWPPKAPHPAPTPDKHPIWTEQDFWYPPEMKPARAGIYKVRISGDFGLERFSYWVGKHWGIASPDIAQANSENFRLGVCVVQNLQWRGVIYDKQ